MSTAAATRHPNGRDPRGGGAAAAVTVCPYCGQSLLSLKGKALGEAQARIAGEERAREAKIKQDLEARFAREKAQAETKARGAVEQAKKEAAKVAEHQIKTLKTNQDAVIAARLKAQREASEKKLAEALPPNG